MKRILFSFVLGTLAWLLVGNAHAATPAEATALVTEAIQYIADHGTEQAFQKISDQAGPFVKGETYLFVVAFDGNTLAHGGNPKLVGKSLKELRDANGTLFIQKMIDQAQKGPGWVDYKWTNPTTKKVQDKTTYVVPVPGANALIGCGIYK